MTIQGHWRQVASAAVNILLLSAYAAQSHVHWQHSLRSMLSECRWEVLELPPRHFSWRVRGNPLYWALQERDVLVRQYDLVLATSMVDLATLRGLVPSLAAVPTVVYFHENQFAYPQQNQQHNLLEAQMVSIYSALAADSLMFNSAYNCESFLSGCEQLLRRLPDKVPPGVVDLLRGKAVVVPVPVATVVSAEGVGRWPEADSLTSGRALRLLWTGRFEYDKGGEGLLAILQQLESDGFDYTLAVVGQQFRNSPAVFEQIREDYSHRLIQFGYIEALDDYRALLRGADIALSTALHEFQGLALLEAVAAQCIPAVPDRLAYREIYPQQFRYRSSADGDPQAEARSGAELVQRLALQLQQGRVTPPDISAFDPQQLAARYRNLFATLVGASG
jgi:glycosyltransferase involved in cell wall biosynthesis